MLNVKCKKNLWVIKWQYIGYKVLQAVYQCRILRVIEVYSYLTSRIYFTPILWRTVPFRTLSESGFKNFLPYKYKTSRPLTSINNGTEQVSFPRTSVYPANYTSRNVQIQIHTSTVGAI